MIRIFNWFRRGSLERGLDRELEYHVDRRVADLTASGMPETEARRVLADIAERMQQVGLTLHPDKTQIVYGKDANRPHRFERWDGSDVVTPCVLDDFGDALRIHHCFSAEPFSKDKFEYALERVLNLCGIAARRVDSRTNPVTTSRSPSSASRST